MSSFENAPAENDESYTRHRKFLGYSKAGGCLDPPYDITSDDPPYRPSRGESLQSSSRKNNESLQKIRTSSKNSLRKFWKSRFSDTNGSHGRIKHLKTEELKDATIFQIVDTVNASHIPEIHSFDLNQRGSHYSLTNSPERRSKEQESHQKLSRQEIFFPEIIKHPQMSKNKYPQEELNNKGSDILELKSGFQQNIYTEISESEQRPVSELKITNTNRTKKNSKALKLNSDDDVNNHQSDNRFNLKKYNKKTCSESSAGFLEKNISLNNLNKPVDNISLTISVNSDVNKVSKGSSNEKINPDKSSGLTTEYSKSNGYDFISPLLAQTVEKQSDDVLSEENNVRNTSINNSNDKINKKRYSKNNFISDNISTLQTIKLEESSNPESRADFELTSSAKKIMSNISKNYPNNPGYQESNSEVNIEKRKFIEDDLNNEKVSMHVSNPEDANFDSKNSSHLYQSDEILNGTTINNIFEDGKESQIRSNFSEKIQRKSLIVSSNKNSQLSLRSYEQQNINMRNSVQDAVISIDFPIKNVYTKNKLKSSPTSFTENDEAVMLKTLSSDSTDQSSGHQTNASIEIHSRTDDTLYLDNYISDSVKSDANKKSEIISQTIPPDSESKNGSKISKDNSLFSKSIVFKLDLPAGISSEPRDDLIQNPAEIDLAQKNVRDDDNKKTNRSMIRGMSVSKSSLEMLREISRSKILNEEVSNMSYHKNHSVEAEDILILRSKLPSDLQKRFSLDTNVKSSDIFDNLVGHIVPTHFEIQKLIPLSENTSHLNMNIEVHYNNRNDSILNNSKSNSKMSSVYEDIVQYNKNPALGEISHKNNDNLSLKKVGQDKSETQYRQKESTKERSIDNVSMTEDYGNKQLFLENSPTVSGKNHSQKYTKDKHTVKERLEPTVLQAGLAYTETCAMEEVITRKPIGLNTSYQSPSSRHIIDEALMAIYEQQILTQQVIKEIREQVNSLASEHKDIWNVQECNNENTKNTREVCICPKR